MLVTNKYHKDTNFIVFQHGQSEPFRYKSDNSLYYAGSVEDALLDLGDQFYCVPVSQCSDELQKEYEQIIDMLD